MKKIFRLPDDAKRAPNDVEREIDLHIDLRAREFEASGMSRDEARGRTQAFGDRGSASESCRHSLLHRARAPTS
jgi:hypothetical protein